MWHTLLLLVLGLVVPVLAGPNLSAQAAETDLLDRVKLLDPSDLKAVLDRAYEGDTEAQVMAGLAYQHGHHVPQMLTEAVKWYRKAADQGNAPGEHLLGWMYLNGDGVEQDLNQAHEWIRKSAEQGYAAAQCDYGLLFLDGVGVPQDNAAAFKWFSLATEQGSLTGLTYLGVMFVNGLGVPPNLAQGLLNLEQAARRGSPMAQANLGVMYANGTGLEQDVSEALIWLFMAEQGGMENVAPLISNLTRTLSAGEVNRLEELAKQRFEECASRQAMASEADGAIQPAIELDGDSARAVMRNIGEWLGVNLARWGTFSVDMTRDMARARSQDEVVITLRGRNAISDVSLEQCVLHYTVTQTLDPSAPPVRWEADIHLGVIDLSGLRVQQYGVPAGWRTVGGSRSEVYLRARNYPELYFILVTPERWKGMTREVSIPILKHDYAVEVESQLRRAAKLCGAL